MEHAPIIAPHKEVKMILAILSFVSLPPMNHIPAHKVCLLRRPEAFPIVMRPSPSYTNTYYHSRRRAGTKLLHLRLPLVGAGAAVGSHRRPLGRRSLVAADNHRSRRRRRRKLAVGSRHTLLACRTAAACALRMVHHNYCRQTQERRSHRA